MINCKRHIFPKEWFRLIKARLGWVSVGIHFTKRNQLFTFLKVKFEENVDGPDKTDSKKPDKNIIILHIKKLFPFRAMTFLVTVLMK